MSHLEERKEKTCLNCGAGLYGRYCHQCGQENLEPKESVWHLVDHFFRDITHFDGKFFSTVKYLLAKPGFLSLEYMKGRRASYLNPIRMYVFTSAFFFLIFFSFANTDKIMVMDKMPETTKEGVSDWLAQKAKLEKRLEKAKAEKEEDSTEIKVNIAIAEQKIAAAKKIYGDTNTRKFSVAEVALLLARIKIDTLKNIPGKPAEVVGTTNNELPGQDSAHQENDIGFFDSRAQEYSSVAAYDSAQQKLFPGKRDGWFKQQVIRKMIEVNNEFKKDKRGFFEQLREKFIHSFPKILFISLPFFALILKLVYARRKQFYYTSHGIFAIHLYCAAFILQLIMILLGRFQDVAQWKWLDVIVSIIDFAIWAYLFVYLYKAMRKFYGQGRFKTMVKYLIINLLAIIMNSILLGIFVLISAISI
ncbi:MAG: DUF3667 domain-containing protein [Bacteroidetes bacterium]|nr:DUF3667 domain-containing protein [Bacteroidota bacterium]